MVKPETNTLRPESENPAEQPKSSISGITSDTLATRHLKSASEQAFRFQSSSFT